jgi:tetratricopeptide (TPR) repeat protein
MRSAAIGRTLAAIVVIALIWFPLVSGYAQSPSTAPATSAQTLSRLNITLPENVAAAPPVQPPLEILQREKCDQQAIIQLANALNQVSYRREAATALIQFSSQCGGFAPALRGAASILLKLSDYITAESVATGLIKLEPFNGNNYFLRALARDGNKSPKDAIDDYVTAIELVANKDHINGIVYYKEAADYANLGQFCDALLPLEQWIALDPSRHNTTQTQAMLSDYTAKGGCETATTGGAESFPAARLGTVIKVPVVANNISGIFILDTGASFVALKESFAERANIESYPGSAVRLHTANGIADGKRGRAETIQLRSLKAKSVPVVIESDSAAAFGDKVDGLLGLSFLSRFNVTIDGQTVRIATRTPQ